MPDRRPILVRPAHLPVAPVRWPSRSPHRPRDGSRIPACFPRDAQRVEVVLFGQCAGNAPELGTPAGSAFDGQAGIPQAPIKASAYRGGDRRRGSGTRPELSLPLLRLSHITRIAPAPEIGLTGPGLAKVEYCVRSWVSGWHEVHGVYGLG